MLPDDGVINGVKSQKIYLGRVWKNVHETVNELLAQVMVEQQLHAV